MSDDAIHSDASETSDMSEISKISTISVRSTQSERPHRKLSEFTSKMESRAGGSSSQGSKNARAPLNRSLSNSDVGHYEKTDGSISDSAVSSSVTEGRKRRPSLGYKVAALVGLSRKSNSTSQLSATGTVHLHPSVTQLYCMSILYIMLHAGLLYMVCAFTGGKKPRASFQRSEEVGAAAELRNRMVKQASKDSTDGSIGSISSDSSSA